MRFWFFIFVMCCLLRLCGNKNSKCFRACYERLGCIEVNENWYDRKYRPINLNPLDRHTIHTEFALITKKDNNSDILLYDMLNLNPDTISISKYRKRGGLVMLIHDFTSNGYTGWIKHIARAILNKQNTNVISVDWQHGAEPPFDLAIANARVVALEATALINLFKRDFELCPKRIHLIGHGVGAHIAGYIGSSTTVGQITGLDPTGPRFNYMPREVRLDETDAPYVEILHTDAHGSVLPLTLHLCLKAGKIAEKSQGTPEVSGHADFFINNGRNQPECNDNIKLPHITRITRCRLSGGQIYPGCSHKRAFKYYIESLENDECEFTGFQCVTYEDFLVGGCANCDDTRKCTTFGRPYAKERTFKHCINSADKRIFYLATSGKRNHFCLNPYRVVPNVGLDNNTRTVSKFGRLNASLQCGGRQVHLFDVYGKPRYFETRSQPMLYYTPERRLIPHSVILEWLPLKTRWRRANPTIHVSDVAITALDSAETDREKRFCPSIDSGFLTAHVLMEYVDCKSKACQCPSN